MKTNSDTTPALYIEPDVHKEKTSTAIADLGSNGEVRLLSEVATTQVALERAIRRIAKPSFVIAAVPNMRNVTVPVSVSYAVPSGMDWSRTKSSSGTLTAPPMAVAKLSRLERI